MVGGHGCRGGGGGPPCHGHGHHAGPHGPPPFLMNATEETRQQFFQITRNDALTKAQMQTQMDAWAAAQSAEVQAAYAQDKQMRAQWEQQAKPQLANATAEVQQLASQIEAVKNDMNITHAQERQQIETIMRGASQTAVAGLRDFQHQMKPSGPPPNA